MNRVVLIGRLTKDVYANGTGDKKVARYTLAVDRKGKDNGADFISCVTFGKSADFAESYLHKGTKIAVEGRIQTGNYTNKDGQKVYTTDVVVEQHEFVESKSAASDSQITITADANPLDGFVNVPDDIGELPFS